MTKRGSILVLTKLAPWRLNGGALIRNYWMIHALAEAYDVDLFIADDAPEAPVAFRDRLRSIRAFPRPAGRTGTLMRGLDALRPDRPLYAAGCVTAALADATARALAENAYSAVQADLNMVAALPRTLRTPLLFNAHNCEFALQRRRALTERPPLAQIIALDALRLRALEAKTLDRAAVVAVCSEDDRKDLAELSPHVAQSSVLVPNGVDTAHYRDVAAASGDARTFAITGSMDWRPNQLGLQWFLTDVLPHLRQSDSAFRIRVAGRMTETMVRELSAYPEIDASPNPVDMRTELAQARFVVAPITASSGTRLRILEAWAAGRPVVTTTHGALGLDYTDGEELIARDEPQALAAAILRMLDDTGLQAHVRERALMRVAQYDWHPIGIRLLEAVSKLDGTAVAPGVAV